MKQDKFHGWDLVSEKSSDVDFNDVLWADLLEKNRDMLVISMCGNKPSDHKIYLLCNKYAIEQIESYREFKEHHKNSDH